MPLTNYPNGVSSFGVPLMGGGVEIPATTGNYFFVDSGIGSDGYSGKSSSVVDRGDGPFATIDYAIGKATASNGDVIIVMPGHAESIAAAITMDVIGLTIIGLGVGATVPTITFTDDLTISITAASSRLCNFRLVLGVATVAVGVTVGAADVTVEKIETIQHATSQFTCHISVEAHERVKILNNTLRTLITDSSTQGLLLNGCDNIIVAGNIITGDFGTAALSNETDEVLNALIIGNIIHNVSAVGGELALEMDADATGLLVENYIASGIAQEGGYDEGGMLNMETYTHDSAADSFAIPPGSTVA